MNTERAQVGWGVWLRWVLATSVVPSVVSSMALVITESVRDSDLIKLIAPVLGIVLGLASMVIAQWLVLRRQVSRAGWWLLVPIVGLVVGSFADAVLRGVLGADAVVGVYFSKFMGIAVYGAITGGVMVWLLRQSATKELSPSQAAE